MLKNRFFSLFFTATTLPLCTILASCTHQPVELIVPENRKERVIEKTFHPPSEEILTCLEEKLTLPREELQEEYDRVREDFITDRNDEKRIRLICLCLARLEESESLGYAQELMKDMEHFDTISYPDIRGLSALLNYFEHLQKKRVTEIKRARQEINELKKQLEQLKNIEDIINERKNGN